MPNSLAEKVWPMKKRLLSLDALRGFDMLLVMGLGEIVVALCAVLGFGTDCAQEHVPEGLI